MAAFRLADEAKSVSSVHVPVKLLTDKERARFNKVEALMSSGSNPYNMGGAVDAGGSILDKPERLTPNPANYLTDSQVKALEVKWRRGVSDPDLRIKVDLEVKPPVLDPDKIACTFCETIIPKILATHGKGMMRTMRKIEWYMVDGIKTFDEVIKHFPEKVVACPDCVLLVKDVRFPESHG